MCRARVNTQRVKKKTSHRQSTLTFPKISIRFTNRSEARAPTHTYSPAARSLVTRGLVATMRHREAPPCKIRRPPPPRGTQMLGHVIIERLLQDLSTTQHYTQQCEPRGNRRMNTTGAAAALRPRLRLRLRLRSTTCFDDPNHAPTCWSSAASTASTSITASCET